jgi:hypothetical protein
MTWQSCVAATTSRRTGQAAIVIDDQASTDPWRPGGRGSGPNRGDLSVSRSFAFTHTDHHLGAEQLTELAACPGPMNDRPTERLSI